MTGTPATDDPSPSVYNGQLRRPSRSPIPRALAEERGANAINLNGAVAADGIEDNATGGKQGRSGSSPPVNGSVDARAVPQIKIPRGSGRKRSNSEKVVSPNSSRLEKERVLKLSPAQIQELTSEPTSLPLRPATPGSIIADGDRPSSTDENTIETPRTEASADSFVLSGRHNNAAKPDGKSSGVEIRPKVEISTPKGGDAVFDRRPSLSLRTMSSPITRRKQSAGRPAGHARDPSAQKSSRPTPLGLDDEKNRRANGTPHLKPSAASEPMASPMPPTIPLPPLSVPAYLQLELASDKPSPLYIHRSTTADFPYESSKVKFERLLNFLLLPPQLEQILWFGTLACLDAWLYTFTILPLRFVKAVWIVIVWWTQNAAKEASDLASFVYLGLGRLWRRRRGHGGLSAVSSPADDGPQSSRRGSVSHSASPLASASHRENGPQLSIAEQMRKQRRSLYRHRRTKSTPSSLQPTHKADILKGLLVLTSCIILMRFDASRMYHGIRGQAAIKLYVIYNVLEVCDRLFSALGQDVLECLFSRETLERDADGRSKISRPFWMFLLALAYNVIHATALFYQVITLNVAVNSYSNALLTLLMSNQFVEIKGTVFKKFEKENLFQLTCADVVERFQLWLMLMIIALRNIVEVGGLSINMDHGAAEPSASTGAGPPGSNATGTPLRSTSIIPMSFTILPKWTGQVFGPFLLVLGSEMLVDWLKHAYITKFNNTKPAVYGRFLDVLAKDYYTNAFADQNLTKRLGLPVLPLACLFIRSIVQTYHMFLATYMPLPIPSTATSLDIDPAASSSSSASPATTAALAHLDHIFRRALGRSSFGAGASSASSSSSSSSSSSWWIVDDLIACVTMLVVFLVVYLILLAAKLVLGMALLAVARGRYRGMKERERAVSNTGGRRVGGWGVVEVDEDKKRWIYVDDADGLRAAREREAGVKGGVGKREVPLGEVGRYSMVAKRIW